MPIVKWILMVCDINRNERANVMLGGDPESDNDDQAL